MRSYRFFTLAAALLVLLTLNSGCSAFRAIFGGKNVSEGYRRESERRQQRKENRKHRDPVADMFDLQKMRDPAPKHMGISLSDEDKKLVEREEEALERDRMRIREYHKSGEDSRRERSKWVIGF